MRTRLFVLVVSILTVGSIHAEPPPKLAQVIADLKSDDVSLRMNALSRLRNLGPEARPAVPALIEYIDSEPIGDLRLDAFLIIEKVGQSSPELLKALHRQMEDVDPLVRVVACETLFHFDPSAAKKIIPILVEALRLSREDPGQMPPSYVYRALGRMGSEAKPAEAVVLEGAYSMDLIGRLWIVGALRAMGPDPERTLPALLGLLEDANSPRHMLGFGAHYGKKAASPLLVGRLQVSEDVIGAFLVDCSDIRTINRLTQERILEGLADMGRKARLAVPFVKRYVDHPQLGAVARKALAKIDEVQK
jgi:HEAT repeat protein